MTNLFQEKIDLWLPLLTIRDGKEEESITDRDEEKSMSGYKLK